MSATTARSPRHVTNALDAQALASRRLGFSVTQACPLRCAHCSVSAAPDLAATTFDARFTDKVVGEMPDLARAEISCIDFTGGEPTLAADFVQRVSKAARDHGIATGIVTAAHWATTDAQARKFVRRFADVEHWDISTDIYHLPFVPLERVRRAFEVLASLGRPPMVRIAYHDPLTYPEAVLIDAVHKFAEKRIGFQPIGPVGRGANLVGARAATLFDYDRGACPTTGPLVQPGGGVAPCCAPLSHEAHDHPLRLGNAFREPLVDIVTRWRLHPLLQTIRLWGFEPVVEWLRAEMAPHLRGRQCDTCVAVARDAALMTRAARLAEKLENRIRVAQALKTHFGERWMEEALLAEAAEYVRLRREGRHA